MQSLRKEIGQFKVQVKRNNLGEAETLMQKIGVFKERQMVEWESMAEQSEQLGGEIELVWSRLQDQKSHIQELSEEEEDTELVESDEEPASGANWERKLLKLKTQIDGVDKEIFANGGLRCGWPEQDHSLFLKLKTKFAGPVNGEAFAQLVTAKLPVFSQEQVEEHVSKYLKHLRLENSKREHLEAYRRLRSEKD